MRKLSIVSLVLLVVSPLLEGVEVVVLLHGLARTPASMEKMEERLRENGYAVANIGYPSRQFSIEELSRQVRESIDRAGADAERVHFVTHSMGGVLLRYIQKHFPVGRVGRVVMLSPPNQGSEVVDFLRDVFLFEAFGGPAGEQLGTDADGLLAELGPVDFELGVITGDRSINWINSMIIPGKDDGKVSVERARVEGMVDFKVVHATHPYIMTRSSVIRDVVAFLRNGKFTAEAY